MPNDPYLTPTKSDLTVAATLLRSLGRARMAEEVEAGRSNTLDIVQAVVAGRLAEQERQSTIMIPTMKLGPQDREG
jgi:hypothetical protein